MINYSTKTLVALAIASALAACDGGGLTPPTSPLTGEQDTTAPVIALIGNSSVAVEEGTAYTDAGAAATDDIDGNIDGDIVTGGDTVDASTADTYTITYNVSDAAGNAAEEVTRTVTVADTTIPVISITGDNPQSIDQDASYTDAGATATDNIDSGISNSEIVTGGDTVDTSTVGAYSVTYTVSDSSGNEATATRVVNVIDVTAPVITLSGDNPQTVALGGTYTEAGATATDAVDDDSTISGNIVIVSTAVDTSTAGSYTVTYNVSDDAGNAATQVTRTVTVPAPAIPRPVLNDSGLTWGGNYPNGNNLDCTGETIAEQDCSHGRDKEEEYGNLSKTGAGAAGFDFTKLGVNGGALAATATAWDCVKDNHTGLIWEVKTDTAQGTDLHSKADTYTWYNTDSSTNGGADGTVNEPAYVFVAVAIAMAAGADGTVNESADVCTGYSSGDTATYCNTEAFVARVNSAGHCGATDWRLPTAYELQSIVDFGRSNPAIDTAYFPNTETTLYWSSSPSAYSSYGAWVVGFNYGYDDDGDRLNGNHVRLVRSGQ